MSMEPFLAGHAYATQELFPNAFNSATRKPI